MYLIITRKRSYFFKIRSTNNVLKSEENVVQHDGCPEFKKPGSLDEADERRVRPYPKRKQLGDVLKSAKNNGRFYLGNPEMTRLWNLSSNNLEACKGQDRSFLPSLEQYMGEAISQMDPASGIDQEYKRVSDPNFGWRALRLLAQRSTCFFTPTNNNKPITKLPDFIENSLKTLLKEQPSLGGEEIDIKMEPEEEPKEAPIPAARDDSKMNEEAMEGVATRLGEEWLRLAAKLGYKDSKDAMEMLRTWVVEDEDATAENMAYMLEGLKLTEAAEYLKANFCKPEPVE